MPLPQRCDLNIECVLHNSLGILQASLISVEINQGHRIKSQGEPFTGLLRACALLRVLQSVQVGSFGPVVESLPFEQLTERIYLHDC